MRLIDADALIDALNSQDLADWLSEQDEYSPASIVEHALETLPIADAEPVIAIPVQFITDKINGLEYLQKKMAAWTTPELEIQVQTLVNLIFDYAQIARSKEE